ncbi:hypothetical protein MBLNU457_2111t1 [Dothideomycetes sp. NU457]
MARHSDSLPQSRDGIGSESSMSKTSLPVRASFESSRAPTAAQDQRSVSGNASSGSHQNFVLTDPVAFRYLEEDPSTTVLDRQRELTGYECYIVEQWATSRTHPTFVITTYTGDTSDRVMVGVLSVPTDESRWSQRLRVYFKALNQYHARRRETALGIMMVTNLSGFPSSLTVIPVPEGDLRKHRAEFFVNENLKRLGCSGRVGLTFAYPNGATIAKFHQLYKTSDKNPLYSSVIELVKLCQASLHMFGQLDIDYVDGLLCDVTEKAINDWWLGIGTDIYNIEPHDGILGPTTAAGLLGLLMGARNRLHAVGSPVPKDPFELEDMKRGIFDFQKSQRLPRSRRLDRHTILKLHKASEKYVNSEGWRVPRAVKSTVAELSGKGGEVLADVIGRRDRAGVADIETTDMEQFEQLVFGERCKWLWQAKPLKRTSAISHGEASLEGHLVMKPDEASGFSWSARKQPTTQADVLKTNETKTKDASARGSMDDPDASREEHMSKQGMNRKSTDLVDEGRGGFRDRLKDAVHLRRHQTKASRDDNRSSSDRGAEQTPTNTSSDHYVEGEPISSSTSQTHQDALSRSPAQQKRGQNEGDYASTMVETPTQNEMSILPEIGEIDSNEHDKGDGNGEPSPLDGPEYHGVDLQEALLVREETEQIIPPVLRRTQSYSAYISQHLSFHDPSEAAPRHLSFSVAASSTELPPDTTVYPSAPKMASYETQLAHEKTYTAFLQNLREELADLSRREATWTHARIDALTSLIPSADADISFAESSLYEPSQRYAEIKDLAAASLRDEKDIIGEGRKELETLAAKLDYEIANLRSKVEDAEVGVKDFERSVEAVDTKLKELEGEWEKSEKWSWTSCVVM